MDPTKKIRFTTRRGQKDPLSRQIEEAALISWGIERGMAYGPKDKPELIICLNRKEEAFGPRVRFKKN